MGQGEGGRGLDDLTQRQKELKDRLGQLQKQMREKGGQQGQGRQQLQDAEGAMQSAEEALQRGDLQEANEQQSRALDQMRQGAQNMAQEMMRNMPQRYGQSGDTPRDPLGRPQRTQGPDLGTSVKVPDQIDVQRAREILEELRRRLGEATRAPVELDYLERLLRRF
jgi:DNA anti-recombination protein RmuC